MTAEKRCDSAALYWKLGAEKLQLTDGIFAECDYFKKKFLMANPLSFPEKYTFWMCVVVSESCTSPDGK